MRVVAGRNKVADIEKMRPCIKELEDKVKVLPTETVMNVLKRLKITNKQSFDRIMTNNNITRHQKRMITRYYDDALRRGREVQNRNKNTDAQSQLNRLYQNAPLPSQLNKAACDELMAKYKITTPEEALEMFSSDRITDTQLAQILECIRTRNQPPLGSVAARAAAINASNNTQLPLPRSRSASLTNVANYGNQRATNLEQGRNPTRAPDATSGKGRRTRRNRRK
jgi:DNA-directed RNA polymerase subunit H (RpoH/RPB5)